ncbi:carbohydrate kinase family protein [Roseinatronobacter sp. S2]|uniref:carbohydrate kinase family protein n=1 Tax=Roseinatronobacter sp. S2 TaxID=3035471 RepID=UPI00240F6980|nr:PfkB family carbohydrate kinase [Roseinatronobacter sp. S2]WFE76690.1 PfkB family carbohydrate kinase [Roseinatronobacter sp. S2]
MRLAAASYRTGAILCAGRLYCDLVMSDLPVMPNPGREVYAGALTLAAGGGAYITAAYCAALGRVAGLAAYLPAEPFGAALHDELATAGLELSLCRPSPKGVDPQITVAMIMNDDRAFLTRRAGPALPTGLDEALGQAGYGHLHLGELATLAEYPALVRAAKAAGMTVSCDCSWDAAVLERADLPALLTGVDVFLPNASEAEALARHAPLAVHAPLVVVKDGARGAYALSGGKMVQRPARAAHVVDTVGAGDAFNAGFIDAWLARRPLPECLDAGHAVAAAALGRHGGARGLGALVPLRHTSRRAAE